MIAEADKDGDGNDRIVHPHVLILLLDKELSIMKNLWECWQRTERWLLSRMKHCPVIWYFWRLTSLFCELLVSFYTQHCPLIGQLPCDTVLSLAGLCRYCLSRQFIMKLRLSPSWQQIQNDFVISLIKRHSQACNNSVTFSSLLIHNSHWSWSLIVVKTDLFCRHVVRNYFRQSAVIHPGTEWLFSWNIFASCSK